MHSMDCSHGLKSRGPRQAVLFLVLFCLRFDMRFANLSSGEEGKKKKVSAKKSSSSDSPCAKLKNDKQYEVLPTPDWLAHEPSASLHRVAYVWLI